MKTATLLLTCFSLLAQTKPSAAPAAQKSALDKATLESYLRNVELWVPQVTVKVDDAKPSSEIPGFFDVWVHASYNSATKDELYYISKDGHTIIKGAVYDINRNPFQANIDKLKTDGAPGFGPAAAPVTLVVFSDFQCPFCKEEAQVLRGNIASAFPDKVRVYFKDFPLESIHPWARTAALAGGVHQQQNPAAFWDFFDWVYQNQEQIGLDNISGKLQQFAMDKNLDGVQLGRCIDTKAGGGSGPLDRGWSSSTSLGHADDLSERPQAGRRCSMAGARTAHQHRARPGQGGRGRNSRKML